MTRRGILVLVRPLILTAVCLQADPLQASVMSAEDIEISKLEQDALGGMVSGETSAGRESLSFSFSPLSPVELLEAGDYSLSGGFYGGSGAGGRGGYGRGHMVRTGGACPDPAGRLSQGVMLGLPAQQSVCAGFEKLLLPDTLQAALKVTALKDKDGKEVNRPVSAQMSYELDENRLVILPSSGAWSSNTRYEVAIGTEAVDQEGLPLAEPAIFQFLTLADPVEPASFLALEDPQTKLTLGPKVLPEEGFIEINTNPLTEPQATPISVIQSANSKLQGNRGHFAQILAARELNYFNSQNERKDISFQNGSARLSMPLKDANGDGFIDNTNPPVRVKTAAIYFLDETSALWVKVPASSRSGNVVSAPVPHLSVFALIGTEDTSVSDAYAYPVPFRPHGPDAGAGQTGTDAAGVTFTSLPSRAVIEIFNVRGEKVWRGEETTGAGKLVWNVTNTAGQAVASGVYVYIIESSNGERKTGKLAIIR